MAVKIRLTSSSKRELENAIARLSSILASPSQLTKGRMGDYLCYAELAPEADTAVKSKSRGVGKNETITVD